MQILCKWDWAGGWEERKKDGGEGRKFRKTFKAVREDSPLWRNFDFEVYSSINI